MDESTSVQLSGIRTQLSEKEDGIIVAVCSFGDLHRHLEPRQKEGTTSRSVRKASDCRKIKMLSYLLYCFYYFSLEFNFSFMK